MCFSGLAEDGAIIERRRVATATEVRRGCTDFASTLVDAIRLAP
jgi:hypothetical protein